MLTEWEAWVYLAMSFDDGGWSSSGLCSALIILQDDGFVSNAIHRRMFKHMKQVSGKNPGIYWWPSYTPTPRIKFCWKMATHCDKGE